MDGNLAPNAGAEFWEEPEEQVVSERDVLNRMGDPRAVLSDVYEWFKEQADACDKMSNIDMLHPTMSVQAQIDAYQKLRYLLLDKAEEFRGFVDGPDE